MSNASIQVNFDQVDMAYYLENTLRHDMLHDLSAQTCGTERVNGAGKSLLNTLPDDLKLIFEEGGMAGTKGGGKASDKMKYIQKGGGFESALIEKAASSSEFKAEINRFILEILNKFDTEKKLEIQERDIKVYKKMTVASLLNFLQIIPSEHRLNANTIYTYLVSDNPEAKTHLNNFIINIYGFDNFIYSYREQAKTESSPAYKSITLINRTLIPGPGRPGLGEGLVNAFYGYIKKQIDAGLLNESVVSTTPDLVETVKKQKLLETLNGWYETKKLKAVEINKYIIEQIQEVFLYSCFVQTPNVQVIESLKNVGLNYFVSLLDNFKDVLGEQGLLLNLDNLKDDFLNFVEKNITFLKEQFPYELILPAQSNLAEFCIDIYDVAKQSIKPYFAELDAIPMAAAVEEEPFNYSDIDILGINITDAAAIPSTNLNNFIERSTQLIKTVSNGNLNFGGREPPVGDVQVGQLFEILLNHLNSLWIKTTFSNSDTSAFILYDYLNPTLFSLNDTSQSILNQYLLGVRRYVVPKSGTSVEPSILRSIVAIFGSGGIKDSKPFDTDRPIGLSNKDPQYSIYIARKNKSLLKGCGIYTETDTVRDATLFYSTAEVKGHFVPSFLIAPNPDLLSYIFSDDFSAKLTILCNTQTNNIHEPYIKQVFDLASAVIKCYGLENRLSYVPPANISEEDEKYQENLQDIVLNLIGLIKGRNSLLNNIFDVDKYFHEDKGLPFYLTNFVFENKSFYTSVLNLITIGGIFERDSDPERKSAAGKRTAAPATDIFTTKFTNLIFANSSLFQNIIAFGKTATKTFKMEKIYEKFPEFYFYLGNDELKPDSSVTFSAEGFDIQDIVKISVKKMSTGSTFFWIITILPHPTSDEGFIYKLVTPLSGKPLDIKKKMTQLFLDCFLYLKGYESTIASIFLKTEGYDKLSTIEASPGMGSGSDVSSLLPSPEIPYAARLDKAAAEHELIQITKIISRELPGIDPSEISQKVYKMVNADSTGFYLLPSPDYIIRTILSSYKSLGGGKLHIQKGGSDITAQGQKMIEGVSKETGYGNFSNVREAMKTGGRVRVKWCTLSKDIIFLLGLNITNKQYLGVNGAAVRAMYKGLNKLFNKNKTAPSSFPGEVIDLEKLKKTTPNSLPIEEILKQHCLYYYPVLDYAFFSSIFDFEPLLGPGGLKNSTPKGQLWQEDDALWKIPKCQEIVRIFLDNKLFLKHLTNENVVGLLTLLNDSCSKQLVYVKGLPVKGVKIDRNSTFIQFVAELINILEPSQGASVTFNNDLVKKLYELFRLSTSINKNVTKPSFKLDFLYENANLVGSNVLYILQNTVRIAFHLFENIVLVLNGENLDKLEKEIKEQITLFIRIIIQLAKTFQIAYEDVSTLNKKGITLKAASKITMALVLVSSLEASNHFLRDVQILPSSRNTKLFPDTAKYGNSLFGYIDSLNDSSKNTSNQLIGYDNKKGKTNGFTQPILTPLALLAFESEFVKRAQVLRGGDDYTLEESKKSGQYKLSPNVKGFSELDEKSRKALAYYLTTNNGAPPDMPSDSVINLDLTWPDDGSTNAYLSNDGSKTPIVKSNFWKIMTAVADGTLPISTNPDSITDEKRLTVGSPIQTFFNNLMTSFNSVNTTGQGYCVNNAMNTKQDFMADRTYRAGETMTFCPTVSLADAAQGACAISSKKAATTDTKGLEFGRQSWNITNSGSSLGQMSLRVEITPYLKKSNTQMIVVGKNTKGANQVLPSHLGIKVFSRIGGNVAINIGNLESLTKKDKEQLAEDTNPDTKEYGILCEIGDKKQEDRLQAEPCLQDLCTTVLRLFSESKKTNWNDWVKLLRENSNNGKKVCRNINNFSIVKTLGDLNQECTACIQNGGYIRENNSSGKITDADGPTHSGGNIISWTQSKDDYNKDLNGNFLWEALRFSTQTDQPSGSRVVWMITRALTNINPLVFGGYIGQSHSKANKTRNVKMLLAFRSPIMTSFITSRTGGRLQGGARKTRKNKRKYSRNNRKRKKSSGNKSRKKKPSHKKKTMRKRK